MVRRFTTPVLLPLDPANPLEAATKQYVDAQDATKQPLDSDLTTIAGLTATTDNFLVAASSAWASRTPAQAKTSLALTKSDVGLGTVDNTSDVGKPVSTAQQTALDGKQPLDSDLTTIAGLTATTDNFMVSASSAWASRTPAQAKTSLALTKSDVGLGSVDNTSDTGKPVSTAQQTALDGKQPLDSDLTTIAGLTATTDNFMVSSSSAWASRTPAQAKTALSLVKGDVGLGSVDNTADTGKPVSTAQQTALDGKQPLDSDLTTIAGLTATTDNFLVAAASAWASRTPTQAKTSLALTKSDVGLGSVDNTSDTGKPVSTAQQTALDLKVPTSRTVTAGTGLTGGGDLSADRTFTIAYGTSGTTACIGNDSRLSDSRAPNGTAGGALNGSYPNPAVDVVPWAPVALTDAATIVVDASLGNHFRVTLAASGHVFGTPSNPTDGQKIVFEIIQDGTGTRTMTTWNSPYTFGTDVTQPTLTTTLNKRDFIGFVYNSTASLWYCLAVSKGY